MFAHSQWRKMNKFRSHIRTLSLSIFPNTFQPIEENNVGDWMELFIGAVFVWLSFHYLFFLYIRKLNLLVLCFYIFQYIFFLSKLCRKEQEEAILLFTNKNIRNWKKARAVVGSLGNFCRIYFFMVNLFTFCVSWALIDGVVCFIFDVETAMCEFGARAFEYSVISTCLIRSGQG